ncbi:MAG: C40 family peptidase [Bernardetiaceae bacterium]
MRTLSTFLCVLLLTLLMGASCSISRKSTAATTDDRPLPVVAVPGASALSVALPTPEITSTERPERMPEGVLKGLFLAQQAEQYLGAPYRYSGMTPKGFDCSGFTCFIFKELNLDLPHGSSSQALLGRSISLDSLRVGDLLFFRREGSQRIFHVALVTAAEEDHYSVIHATSRGVVVDRSNEDAWKNYWHNKVAFARRVLE